MATVPSHYNAVDYINSRQPTDIATVTAQIVMSHARMTTVYPSSSIKILDIKTDAGVASQCIMKIGDEVYRDSDSTHPTLAQVIALVLAVHW